MNHHEPFESLRLTDRPWLVTPRSVISIQICDCGGVDESDGERNPNVESAVVEP